MPLNAAVNIDRRSVTAGGAPAQVSVVVYNPGAATVLVTGIQISASRFGSSAQTLPFQASVPATGPGQAMTVAAGATITIGPFPIAFGSAAYIGGANPTVISPDAAAFPNNAQPSQPTPYIATIAAMVFGSDGSSNIAAPAGILVSHSFQPPASTQGGYLNFAVPQNSCGFIPGLP